MQNDTPEPPLLELAGSPAVSLWEEWPGLSEEKRVERFRALPREESDEFFLSLAPVEQASLVRRSPRASAASGSGSCRRTTRPT